MAAWALQFLLLEQREIAWSWLLLGANLIYFNGDTNIWSSKQKQKTVQSFAEALPHPSTSVQEAAHIWDPLNITSAWGWSCIHNKTPLETLTTNLHIVQYLSWQLQPPNPWLLTSEGLKSRIKHLNWDQTSQGLHPSTSGSITTLPTLSA